ncbi:MULTISPECIES: aromatic-ring-hydroxylating dioxygenase subunit beta [Paraburkholderia]|uniref:Salicylate 5-hydroxylase small subunit n=1 Tax=Paraburkholderia megapolitana TaxID=420953 RepID=A0A1I3MQK7_9BURK|nr:MULTISPECIES: aromatic-ring-hydroxylating dioxygenase subunit beta [Paraburkholderia]MCX4161842.1 aromatic-ring-hydroxylating dioxygenase subunit beta [Paraburkholderia megapolitana]MDN7157339.1 aromatic-ring-hydroxylating dioxygenase subunit beta [Paraburkholderia sp. CHISQ3]MDQ6494384.1 aromatic-ring-hydroxylating dioxygenase subunit beta [Paraburkholderia megapolitana]QDQ84098.1 aromatic-ring-hydroxylating dioxygenase subunit beta [Paraburkholderia megapolitana]SFI99267.1 salicylate 5-hy
MKTVDFKDYYALVELYAGYSAALDSGDWDRWPEFFTDDCLYRIVPRENHEQNLPLALLALETKAMLKDRAYGIKETFFYDPYYQRHIVDNPLIRATDGDVWEVEANYAVLRTKTAQLSEVYNTGRYFDRIRKTPDGLRFATRVCVFDSELIPNSMIFPL